MSNISTYLEEKWLQETFIDSYCGLISDAETGDLEAGEFDDEITGYAGNRPAITFSSPSQAIEGHEGKAAILNTAAIDFEVMPESADREIKYAIVCDAATAGHILYWLPLLEQKSWNSGDTFRIPVGKIILDLA